MGYFINEWQIFLLFILYLAVWECIRNKDVLSNDYSFELDKCFPAKGPLLKFDEIWLSHSSESDEIFTSHFTLYGHNFLPLNFG